MNPSAWINTLSLIVVDIALVALVVLAVAGSFNGAGAPSNASNLPRGGSGPAPGGA